MGKVRETIERGRDEAVAEGIWGATKMSGQGVVQALGSATQELVQKRFDKSEEEEKARIKFWLQVLSDMSVKEGMASEKAAKKLAKIQTDYSEEKARPYGDREPYGKNDENRLNKALSIFSKWIVDEDVSTIKMNEFQMRLASLPRKGFDSFIEIALEDNMHRFTRFVSQFLQMLYGQAKNAAGDISKTAKEQIEKIIEALLDEDYDSAMEAVKSLINETAEKADELGGFALAGTNDGIDWLAKAIDENVWPKRRHTKKRWF